MATRIIKTFYGDVTVDDRNGITRLLIEDEDGCHAGVNLSPDEAKKLGEILTAFGITNQQ